VTRERTIGKEGEAGYAYFHGIATKLWGGGERGVHGVLGESAKDSKRAPKTTQVQKKKKKREREVKASQRTLGGKSRGKKRKTAEYACCGGEAKSTTNEKIKRGGHVIDPVSVEKNGVLNRASWN